MIERGHEHRMSPVSKYEPGDGSTIFHFRCDSQPATPENPTPCKLEEERVFRDGQLSRVRYRLNGVWFHPFDLLRSMPLGVQECSVCGGEDHFGLCEVCHGIGVEQAGGGAVVPPELRVTA